MEEEGLDEIDNDGQRRDGIVFGQPSRNGGLLKQAQNDRDGTQLVLIPEGEFIAGGYEGIGPRRRTRLPSYYLAMHPLTNAQYKRFVDATGHRPPDHADFAGAVWRRNSFPRDPDRHYNECPDHRCFHDDLSVGRSLPEVNGQYLWITECCDMHTRNLSRRAVGLPRSAA
jgi:formylglycine-generating enzyme required for sulfatase activity